MLRLHKIQPRRSPLRLLPPSSIHREPNAVIPSWRGLESMEPRTLMSAVTATLWAIADGGNGHRYEAIIVPGGISWEDARAAAEAQGGHLVTITSQAENDFVFSLIDEAQYWQRLNVLGIQANGPWIGLHKTDASLAAADGWQWVTGENFAYSNFAAGEPNRTNELFVSFTARGSLIAPTWQNTLVNIASQPVISYVVEYDAAPAPDPDPVPPNAAPVFISAPPGEATENAAFQYHITATDADGDALQFHAVSMPAWLTLTDNGDGTALLTGTPSFANVGSIDITIEVSDGEEVVQQSFTLTVKAEPLSSIAGVLFNDMNRNGVKDEGESPLAGWMVYDDADASGSFTIGEAFAFSAADGSYNLTGLAPGEHLLRTAAPVDMTILDRTFLRHSLQRQTVKAALSDAKHFTRETIDDRTLVLAFESGDDQNFDEMKIKVRFEENGKVTMTVLSRESKGNFTLIQPEARRIVAGLGKGASRPGKLVKLDNGWHITTPASGTATVSTSAGEQIDGVNFGARERRESSLPRWLWNAMERCFRRS